MTPFTVGNIIGATLREMEEGVYNFTKDGKCSRCGGCCSRLLPLSRKEIKDIKRYVAKHHIERQIHVGAPTAKQLEDLTCPFLDMSNPEETKCLIYKAKPRICSVFICNQPPSQVKENKEMFWRDRIPCDMVEVFFGEG